MPVFGLSGHINKSKRVTWHCDASQFFGETFVIYIIVPFVILIYCYSAIFCYVRRSQKEFQDILRKDGVSKEKRLKMIKMTLIIILGFLITVVPFPIFNLFEKSVEYPNAFIFLNILWWASTVINPLIYCFMKTTYKNDFIHFCRTICVCLPKSKQGDMDSPNQSTPSTGSASTKC